MKRAIQGDDIELTIHFKVDGDPADLTGGVLIAVAIGPDGRRTVLSTPPSASGGGLVAVGITSAETTDFAPGQWHVRVTASLTVSHNNITSLPLAFQIDAGS